MGTRQQAFAMPLICAAISIMMAGNSVGTRNEPADGVPAAVISVMPLPAPSSALKYDLYCLRFASCSSRSCANGSCVP